MQLSCCQYSNKSTNGTTFKHNPGHPAMVSKRRKGRPRKTGPRHRNGHLKLAVMAESPRERASRMPHRRGLGEHAADPAAESELGRMRIRGEVSEPEETAGYVYAPHVAGVRQHAGCP